MILAALAAAATAAAPAPVPEPVQFKSTSTRVHLIELYTAEGCSSCPPADLWLSALKDRKGLWADFVPVAFHVDYWDRLGWKDALGSPRHTARQRRYAKAWVTKRIYTPNFVLDGADWEDWYGESFPPRSEEPAGVLSVRIAGPNRVEVEYETDAFAPVEGWRAHAVLLAMGVESKVTDGENEGRTLRHDFAVASYAVGAMKESEGRHRGAVRLDPPVGIKTSGLALAAWVTVGEDPTPVQAAGGFLP